MKWSLKLARVRGILIQVHWTFLILVTYVAMAYASGGANLAGVAKGVALLLAMFGCVVLHELGHALTAQRFDIHTKDITLLPIGGIARLERAPDEPVEEFFIAVAGPAVNVLIAGVLWAILVATDSLQPIRSLLDLGGPFFVQLMWINVVLVLFNLLPAFPMDGGRILRSLLALRLDYRRATNIAAMMGQAMAIFFAFVALNPLNPFLLFIAIFVFMGARAEAQQVRIRTTLVGLAVRDAMLTDFTVLSGAHPLRDAAHQLLAGSQQDFPVESDSRLIGMLYRPRLVAALKELGSAVPVSEAVEADYATVHPEDSLHDALVRLRLARASSAPVLDAQGQLVGLLTLENVDELMMLRTVFKGRDQRGVLAEIFATD
ncbi:MAG: site-2 protease family protein [Gemmatimonadales bacterium]